VEALSESTDKRRQALDQATGVVAKYVEKQIKSGEERDPEVREPYGARLRRTDLERLRSLGWEERGEGGKSRSMQSLLDEALEILFASREIDLEPLGLKAPHGYRTVVLQSIAKRRKS
jgi:hypothetical protein